MNERAERLQRRLAVPMLVAALLTLPAIVIEQSSTGPGLDAIATTLDWVTWLAFVAEAVLMLRAVDDRSAWLRAHPLEIAIVVFTVPFLPASLAAARVFRLLRLLRLLRIAVLMRRLLSTEGVRDAAVLAAMTVLGGGAAYAAIEKGQQGQHLSTWDGVWWAMTTVTTVGYGDSVPKTVGGRVIAMIVMAVGIGFVAVLTAAAAERFVRHQRQEERDLHNRLDEIVRRLDGIESR